MEGLRRRPSAHHRAADLQRRAAAAGAGVDAHQEFDDFEVVISDNASADRTPELCAAYAAKDRRIRYVRNERNLGSIPNFNKLVGLAKASTSKWAAHDDWCEPEFVGRCVEVLDADPGWCSATPRRPGSTRPATPWWSTWTRSTSAPPTRPSGSARCSGRCGPSTRSTGSSAPRPRTQLFRSHSGSDRILLAELSLLGQLYQIPELLLYERETLSSRSNRRPSFFDTSNKDRPPFKHWRLCRPPGRGAPLQAADAGATGRPGPQHPGPLRDPRRPPHAGRRQTGRSHRAGRGLALSRPLAASGAAGFQVGPAAAVRSGVPTHWMKALGRPRSTRREVVIACTAAHQRPLRM